MCDAWKVQSTSWGTCLAQISGSHWTSEQPLKEELPECPPPGRLDAHRKGMNSPHIHTALYVGWVGSCLWRTYGVWKVWKYLPTSVLTAVSQLGGSCNGKGTRECSCDEQVFLKSPSEHQNGPWESLLHRSLSHPHRTTAMPEWKSPLSCGT